MSRNRILIIGATGKIGSELAKLFQTDKYTDVRLLLRNEKNHEKFDLDRFEIYIGDIANVADIERAVENIDKIFLVTTPSPEQAQLHKNVIDVAKRKKNIHMVRISAMGIDPKYHSPLSETSIAKWHYEVEKYMEESDLPFTHLRPNFFMQNMLVFKNSIQDEDKFYAALHNGKISLVHVADIAAVAYVVLTNDEHIGCSYDITGPEALSFDEIAEQLTKTLDRRIEYAYMSPDILKSKLLQAGTPEWFVNDKIKFFEGYSAGYGEAITDVVKQLTNKVPISFKDFSNEFKI